MNDKGRYHPRLSWFPAAVNLSLDRLESPVGDEPNPCAPGDLTEQEPKKVHRDDRKRGTVGLHTEDFVGAMIAVGR